ncbi:MAG TPA: acyl-CoA dehydratase activase [Anaeromyxobacteraceae bacterium]|nr:acyl-CoA dehydratase activase [Anaeromyxobacteraceae bacterium]
MTKKVLGLDIGSRTAKGALLVGREIFTAIRPTGFHMQETGDALVKELLEKAGVQKSELSWIVGTGYGRITLGFEGIPYGDVTEISCHAKGAHHLHPGVRTIVDIGGQDSKAIKVDPKTGKVAGFVLNDKCAAGTGKFLEMIAASLDLPVERLGEISLQSTKQVKVTSQCVVFAESEVISLKAQDVSPADIAAGVHLSVARRVGNLLSRVGIESDVVFTGGVSKNVGMRKALEEVTQARFVDLRLDAQFAGAIGAAVYAAEYAETGGEKREPKRKGRDLLGALRQDVGRAREVGSDAA